MHGAENSGAIGSRAPGPDSARPAVSAVVVSYNGGQRVLNTLEALHRQRYPLEAIVLVDNRSSDGSTERVRARFPGVEILDMGGNRGPSPARNRGLGHVRTKLVLLVDNDVYVEEDCIEKMVDAWQRHAEPAVVCPRLVLIPEGDVVHAEGASIHFTATMVMRNGYRPVASLPASDAPVDGCLSACLLVHRETVLDAGAFDDTIFYHHEDLEFSIRLRAYGQRFVFTPAVARHDRGAGVVGLSFRGHEREYPARRAYLSVRHRALILLVHYRWRTLLVLAPALIVYELASVGAALLKGFAWQWVRAWGWILGNARWVLGKRRAIQRRRVASDRSIYSGGPIPLAQGFLRSGPERVAAAAVSGMCRAWWGLARHWIA